MITLEQVSGNLECKTYNQSSNFKNAGIENIVASDLMSEVLVAEEEGLLLITALNTEQTLRTAHIVDAVGILLVNGKTPQPGMIKLADEFDITLISTRTSMFRACAALGRMMDEGQH